MSYSTQNIGGPELNRFHPGDTSIHDWYRFVLSFPPHLVRYCIEKFQLQKGATILDPFCGTGTTVVEAKKLGFSSIGIEANPMAHFASSVKVRWPISQAEINRISDDAKKVRTEYEAELENLDVVDLIAFYSLTKEEEELLIGNSISSIIMAKCNLLLSKIEKYSDEVSYDYMRIAISKHIVHSFSNLKFSPEVGVSRSKKVDANVSEVWIREVEKICGELEGLHGDFLHSQIILGDSREINSQIQPCSIDAVITSPPYPNEKDYSRATRLESVFLGFIRDKNDLKGQKRTFIASNTKNIYVDINDHEFVGHIKVIQELSERVEARRLELNKTSGFEKLYYKVVKSYFGGLARHLEAMKGVLKPGASLAYVVGDQASYFQIPIKTGVILAEIADSLGYEVIEIETFRTRLSTTTGDHLAEEIVFLKYMGDLK